MSIQVYVKHTSSDRLAMLYYADVQSWIVVHDRAEKLGSANTVEQYLQSTGYRGNTRWR